MPHILCLDIGGTNPRMAMVYSENPEEYNIIATQRVEGPSLTDAINNFLALCEQEHGCTTNLASISAAGPVENNNCLHMENAKYPIREAEILESTHIDHMITRNDFYMIASGIATLHHGDELLKQIPPPEGTVPKAAEGNRAVIGPGTGLGVAYLTWKKDHFEIEPSEGGHSSIAHLPHFEELFHFLRDTNDANIISKEMVLTGHGIRTIADFFLTHPHALERILKADNGRLKKELKNGFDEERHPATDEEIREILAKNKAEDMSTDAAQTISMAVAHNITALTTMRIFMGFLGSAAQDLVMHKLAVGGLFIAGGISPQNKQLLFEGEFYRTFVDNPAHQRILKKVPVYLVDDYNITWRGCVREAFVSLAQYMN